MTPDVNTEAYVRLKNKNLIKTSNVELTDIQSKDPYKSPNFKAKVKVFSYADKSTHKYFHSMNIDMQVEDFTGTCELRCPYDSDLMEYWEPIRATCVVYGTNKGHYKILFVGRVREIKQDGYEISITLQNYGWKFQQNASASFVEDNVKGKDGYTIMKLIFEALKIDSWSISPSAYKRLKQVGFDDDGNLTLNGKEVEEIPDLINRIKNTNPSETVNNYTIYNKIKEDELNNINHLNYTLKYEEPTPQMQTISDENSYSGGGGKVYSKTYSEGSGKNISGTATMSSSGKVPITTIQAHCPRCNGPYAASSTIQSALSTIYKVCHGGVQPSQAKGAKQLCARYIAQYPTTEKSLQGCLQCIREDGDKNKSFVTKISKAEINTAKKGLKVATLGQATTNTFASFVTEMAKQALKSSRR